MGGLAIGLGFGLAYLFDRTAWWDTDAILDADFANGRFRWDGYSFDNEAAFLTAIGATKDGNHRTFGPYVAPGAPNVVVNGDAATGDLTGWTQVLQASGTQSVSVVSGAFRLTSDGVTGVGGGGGGMVQELDLDDYEGYLLEFTRADSSSSARVGTSLYGTELGAVGNSALGLNRLPFSSRDVEPIYLYLLRFPAGTTTLDNIVVRKAAPFKNFPMHGVSGRIRAKTPTAASGTKAVFSLYNTAATDMMSVFWNSSGELHLEVRRGNSVQADLNLGTLAPATTFDLVFTAKANEFYARVNGGPVISDIAGGWPGQVLMKIGDSPAASTSWGDGDIERITLWAESGRETFYGMLPEGIHTEGDSFIGGAGGVVLPTTLQTLISRPVYNTGTGGAAMSTISARLVTSPTDIKNKVTVIWDGGDNDVTTVEEYADELAAGLVGVDKFIVIPACIGRGQSDLSPDNAIRDEFVSRWPNNVIDWRDVLMFNGSALDDTMYLAGDNIHLSQAAMDLMAAAIGAFITAKGW